ncbi:MAG: sensor histidine kinase [Solirubrobacteraceae bacterium]
MGRVEPRTVALSASDVTLAGEWIDDRVLRMSSPDTTDERAVAPVSETTDIQEAAAKVEARLEQLLEFAPDAVFGVGRDGRIELVNSQVGKIFGYARPELIGEPIEKLIPDRFHSVHPGHRDDYFGDPRTRSMGPDLELYAVRKNGREFLCEILLSSIETAEGPLALAAVRDISDRRHAEEELRRYAAIIAFTSESIISVSSGGKIESCNPSAARLYGYSSDELTGQRFERLTAPTHREALAEAFVQAVAGEQVGPLDTVRLRKDGSTFDASVTLSPIRDASGRVVSVASVSQDISERKRAAAELRRTSDELARSNDDLEQFAYVAAHDLSEPLRTVTGFVQLLADRYAGSLDDDARQFISFAISGTQRMQELLDGLLAYSRAGTMEQRLAEVDCARTVQRVLSSLESSIAEAGAQIDVGELPTVVADPTQVEQLFQNLIANALKFRAASPPGIQISAVEELDRYVVSVADNGIGIVPEHRQRIFKMFQQLHPRDAYSGIGAGLAICRQIAVRHGGQIWVEETPTGGSTFSFSIPRRSLP